MADKKQDAGARAVIALTVTALFVWTAFRPEPSRGRGARISKGRKRRDPWQR